MFQGSSVLLGGVGPLYGHSDFLQRSPTFGGFPGGSPASAGDMKDKVRSLGQEDPLEEEMATHSRILAWRIPWMEEPGGQ